MHKAHPLERLRNELSAPADQYLDPTLYAHLSVIEDKGLLHVHFFGDPFDEPYAKLCHILRTPGVSRIHRIDRGTRARIEGANGTCNWDLTDLVDSDAEFTALQVLSIQQTAPEDHNRRIVAADYDEEGILGRFLRKSPVLDALITPSAPDVSFFTLRDHPLRYLQCRCTGYDTQNFIGNLADSNCFPRLQSLEFGEYNETYLDTFPQSCTAFSDYQRLFLSQAFATVGSFTWRNPICSPEEIAILRALRPKGDLQFKVVRFSSEYVSD